MLPLSGASISNYSTQMVAQAIGDWNLSRGSVFLVDAHVLF
jgi:hypothetical protein